MSDYPLSLLQSAGGYRNLRAFTLARLCYDVTVRFTELYIPSNSRTVDQMVQAACSGVQNIAEGSSASVTSLRTELKLTGVARASLEELRLDYEDFLRHHGAAQWQKGDLFYQEFTKRKISDMEQFRAFINWAMPLDIAHGKCTVQAAIVANGALLLINVTCFLLTRLLEKQAEDFQKNGGFSERSRYAKIRGASNRQNRQNRPDCRILHS